MFEPIIKSLFNFLVMLLGNEIGSTEFYIVGGCTLAAMLVIARLLAGIFGSSKGILVTFFALLTPLCLGAFGYAAVELYVLPLLEADWTESYLAWFVFGVLAFVVTQLVSSKLWDIGKGATVALVLFAVLAGIGTQYGTQLVLEVMDYGSSQVEQRDERLNLEVERR
jgi:hypothetical protein